MFHSSAWHIRIHHRAQIDWLTCRPSCSLACYKLHKVTHEIDSRISPIAAPCPPLKAIVDISTPSIVEKPSPNPLPPGSFQVLVESEELKRLLSTDVTIAPRLREIYNASLEPSQEELERRHQDRELRMSRGRGRGGRGRGGREQVRGGASIRAWTKERGLRDALYWLRRREEEENSDGLEAFRELVLKLCPVKDEPALGQLASLGNLS